MGQALKKIWVRQSGAAATVIESEVSKMENRIKLEKLNLSHFESLAKFSSLGKVKKLKTSSLKENGSDYFEDNALTQIEELNFADNDFQTYETMIKTSQNLKKITFEEYW